MKIENPARSSAPVAVPDLHPSKWRTPRAIPAHAPRLNATADQRMIVERHSIEFMARFSPASPTRSVLVRLPGSAEQQKCKIASSVSEERMLRYDKFA
jgi:hypothetical protein